MFSKTLRIFLMLGFLLGACSSTATDEEVDTGQAAEEVVEDTDDELSEEEDLEEDDVEVEDDVEEKAEESVEEDDSEESVEDLVEEAPDEEVVEDELPALPETPAFGEVILIDAGEEPRQELRYVFSDGTEILTLEQTSAQTQTVDGEPLSGGGPPVGTVIDTRLTRTVDGDLLVIDSEIISGSAAEGTDPATAALVNESLASSLGLRTTSTVDTRGIIVAADTDSTGDPLLDELISSLERATNPFPVEAVGVGATWQVDVPQDALGLSVTNRSTSVVREFTENGVIIDVAIEQISNDIGELVDLGGGFFATVDAWDITGTGFVEIEFDRISPVRAENTISGTQVLSAEGEGTLEQTLMFDTVITSN